MPRSTRISAPLILLLAVATAHAEIEAPVHLQCAGVFTDYRDGAPRELPVEGVSVRVSHTDLIISGSAGFDGEYAVGLRLDSGIGFTARKTPLYGGFLNRFSGKLGLQLAKDSQRKSFDFMYDAKCTKAKPLF